MAVQFVEAITWDTKVLGGAPSVAGKHHFGFDAEASYQRLAVGTRRLLTITGASTLAGHKFVLTGKINCRIVAEDLAAKGSKALAKSNPRRAGANCWMKPANAATRSG